jgi:hypothetical protein
LALKLDICIIGCDTWNLKISIFSYFVFSGLITDSNKRSSNGKSKNLGIHSSNEIYRENENKGKILKTIRAGVLIFCTQPHILVF